MNHPHGRADDPTHAEAASPHDHPGGPLHDLHGEAAGFTEPTTAYWQRFVPASALDLAPPWRLGYPAALPDDGARPWVDGAADENAATGSAEVLLLPIRALPPAAGAPQRHGVASLLVNQASFEVQQRLGDALARRLAPLAPDVVVGLPTLGLGLAARVAQALGHARCVPMGTSRKFWYDDALSAPVVSITSPAAGKRVYLDPHLLPLLLGPRGGARRPRVVVVDDVVSTGSTAQAPWQLLESLGVDVVGFGVAMAQGRRWVRALGAERAGRVRWVLESPLLQQTPEGWVERPTLE